MTKPEDKMQPVSAPFERDVGRPLPERRSDGMPASAGERKLRRMLAVRSGIPHLYCDDGEASGQEHGISIDFMREPVADIEAKLMALNLARFRAAEGEPPNARANLPATRAHKE
jgi:hypothetical protein